VTPFFFGFAGQWQRGRRDRVKERSFRAAKRIDKETFLAPQARAQRNQARSTSIRFL
jgi:hypothetical protein